MGTPCSRRALTTFSTACSNSPTSTGPSDVWRISGPLVDIEISAAIAYSASARQITCHWAFRSEEHTSELQSLMRISYAVFCLKKTNITAKYRSLNTTRQKPSNKPTQHNNTTDD